MDIKEIVKNGINQDAINWSQSKGKELSEDRNGQDGRRIYDSKLTTSQLRRFFGELKRIQNLGFEEGRTDLLMLQAKLAYAVGRSRKRGNAGRIEDFTKIISEGIQAVDSEKKFKNFLQIVEAIVAYHKYYVIEKN